MTHAEARERAAAMLERAGIVLTPRERAGIEVADFGLGRLEEIGLQLVVYVNTERVCAKELVLFPGPGVPRAPSSAGRERSRQGGDVPLPAREGAPPRRGSRRDRAGPGRSVHDPARHAALVPGGREGAVVSEFSTRSSDEFDVFSDPLIVR